MPIKPKNRALYPKDWAAISLAARERARWRCQHPECAATQYSVGRWICRAGGKHEWRRLEGNYPADTEQDRGFLRAGEGRGADGRRWTFGEARAFIARYCWEEDSVPIVIVLTVAHLNHDPTDCSHENLRAMCQRHHLAYDQDHHRANAQATRRAKAGTMELFDGIGASHRLDQPALVLVSPGSAAASALTAAANDSPGPHRDS